ncbi:hypothetical protein ACWGM4_17350 [Streptomyces albidoflavus]
MDQIMQGLVGLSGEDWQDLCVQVLRLEHGTDLVVLPDKGGDGGLEAYTLTGHAFQCYSPKEPLQPKKRYENQRDKATEDIGKFIRNRQKLQALIGEHVKIKRWILMCPLIDTKDLAGHCASLTTRVRNEALSYAHAEIHVICQTMADYEINYKRLVNSQLTRMHLPSLSEPDYSSIESSQIATMHTKLQKVPILRNEVARNAYVQNLLTAYVGSQEYRAYIKDHYTEIDNELEALLEDLEFRLGTEYILHTDGPQAKLAKIYEETEKRIRQAAVESSLGQSRTLSHGQVTDWLMRCPLDFYDEAS